MIPGTSSSAAFPARIRVLHLESFYRRRDRKRARKRFTAGIVGLAIAIVIAVVGSAILRSAPENPPAGTKGTPILREGEVLQVGDQFGPGDAGCHGSGDGTSAHPAGLWRSIVGCDPKELQPSRPMEAGSLGKSACGPAGCGDATEGGGLWVAGADGSPIRVTSSAHPPDVGGWVWAWSPAADQLAFVTGRSGLAELVLLDPATGERTSLTTVAEIATLSWSPDGTAIAIASRSLRRLRRRSRNRGYHLDLPGWNHRDDGPVVVAGWDAARLYDYDSRRSDGSSSSTRMDRTAASSSMKAIHTARGLRAGRRTARGSPTCEHRRSRVPLATSRSRSG